MRVVMQDSGRDFIVATPDEVEAAKAAQQNCYLREAADGYETYFSRTAEEPTDVEIGLPDGFEPYSESSTGELGFEIPHGYVKARRPA